MRINDGNAEYLRSEQLKGVRGAGSEGGPKDAPQPADPVTRSDKVQISDAGRALAARTADTEEGGLSAERAGEIRQRILEKAYDSLDVVDQVARRMLARGDI
jgi:hypothetical protein